MDQELLKKFQQAYRDLALTPLIEREDIANFRVDYGLDIIVRLKKEIEASAKNEKFVFAGHTGCGKSTLLKRLANEMSVTHYVVFFSIADLIELSAVTHTNILYAIALLLLSHAKQNPRIQVEQDIVDTILGWNATTHKQVEVKSSKGELSFNTGIFKFITAKLQQEKSFRDELETTFAKRISELVLKIDRLASAIQIKTEKPVLVIIDDLDKLDLPLVGAIYRDNIRSLVSPQIRIMFTIPISSTQEPQVMGALNSVGIVRPHLFPVAKFFKKEDIHNPAAKPITEKINTFHQVLEKRIPNKLITPEAAHEIILKSGGVMRELVRIAKECCAECMVQIEIKPDYETVEIDQDIVRIALKNIRNAFARQIGSNLYDLLVEVYKTSEAKDSSSEGFVKLLHGLMILEYENDALWYDVHPLVADLLRQKKLI